MATVPVHRGDEGTIVRLTVFEDGNLKDLTGAQGLMIQVTKPDGNVFSHIATFVTNGTDGRIQCVLVANNLDQVGLYEARATYTLSGWTGVSTPTVIECAERGDEHVPGPPAVP